MSAMYYCVYPSLSVRVHGRLISTTKPAVNSSSGLCLLVVPRTSAVTWQSYNEAPLSSMPPHCTLQGDFGLNSGVSGVMLL